MQDGRLVEHADLSKLAPFHCNDMVVDGNGKCAFVGNFGFDLHRAEPTRDTCLIHVAPDGSARVAAEDMCFPNGAVVTPDGGTLIVAGELRSALDGVRPRRGRALTNRRVWPRSTLSRTASRSTPTAASGARSRSRR